MIYEIDAGTLRAEKEREDALTAAFEKSGMPAGLARTAAIGAVTNDADMMRGAVRNFHAQELTIVRQRQQAAAKSEEDNLNLVQTISEAMGVPLTPEELAAELEVLETLGNG